MSANSLEKLWASIIPISSIPKTRPTTVLDTSNVALPSLGPVDKVATQQRLHDNDMLKSIAALSERIDNLLDKVSEAKTLVLQTDGKMNGVLDKMMDNTTNLGKQLCWFNALTNIF